MSAAHTPGKWTVQIGDPSRGAVAYWVSPSSPEEAQAHARLIASAPELLEALKAIQAHLATSIASDKDNCKVVLKLARQAIKKAQA